MINQQIHKHFIDHTFKTPSHSQLSQYIQEAQFLLKEVTTNKKKEKFIWNFSKESGWSLKNFKRKIRRNIIYLYFPEEKSRKGILHMSNKLFVDTLCSNKFIFGLIRNGLHDIQGFIKKICQKIQASEKYGRNHEVWTPEKIKYLIYELLKIQKQLDKKLLSLNIQKIHLPYLGITQNSSSEQRTGDEQSSSKDEQNFESLSAFLSEDISIESESNAVFYSKKVRREDKIKNLNIQNYLELEISSPQILNIKQNEIFQESIEEQQFMI